MKEKRPGNAKDSGFVTFLDFLNTVEDLPIINLNNRIVIDEEEPEILPQETIDELLIKHGLKKSE